MYLDSCIKPRVTRSIWVHELVLRFFYEILTFQFLQVPNNFIHQGFVRVKIINTNILINIWINFSICQVLFNFIAVINFINHNCAISFISGYNHNRVIRFQCSLLKKKKRVSFHSLMLTLFVNQMVTWSLKFIENQLLLIDIWIIIVSTPLPIKFLQLLLCNVELTPYVQTP